MKNTNNTLAAKIIMVFIVLLLAARSNIEAKAANYSSSLGDQEVILYWPTDSTKITSKFGERILNGIKEFHTGVDIKAPTGTGVYAAASGRVKYARFNSSAGNYVLIVHPDGRKTKYCHLSKILVQENQEVETGTKIGLAGSTGRAYGSHLDYQVYDVNGQRIDPESVTLKKRASEVKVPTGYVHIKTTNDGSKVLRFNESGSLVVANRDVNDKNQIFEIIPYNGKYMFKCLGTNSMIDIANGGYECSNPVWSWAQNYTDAQLYDIVYEPNADMYYIISSLSGLAGTDMLLDVSSCDPTLVGSVVHLWSRVKDVIYINQVFNFEPVVDSTPTINISVTAPPVNIKYKKCHNIKGSITSSAPIIKVESFIYDANGVQKDYTLDNMQSGKYSLNIYSSNINKYSDYNKLPRGTYTHTIKVYTEQNGYATWSCNFTVY